MRHEHSWIIRPALHCPCEKLTCKPLLNISHSVTNFEKSRGLYSEKYGSWTINAKFQLPAIWNCNVCGSVLVYTLDFWLYLGVLASEGWWEAWQPSPRWPGAISGQWQSWKTTRWAWGKQVHGNISIRYRYSIFSLQCFDTVGWVTGRASGL